MTLPLPSWTTLNDQVHVQTLMSDTNDQWAACYEQLTTVLAAHRAAAPLALIIDLSALETGYSSRLRRHMEHIRALLHGSGTAVRLAFVMPPHAADSAVFLNTYLRHHETPRIRHQCLTRLTEALVWLQNGASGAGLTAAQNA